MLPLWYMQLIAPHKYGIDAKDKEDLLAKFKALGSKVGAIEVYMGKENTIENWDGKRLFPDGMPDEPIWRTARRIWMP